MQQLCVMLEKRTRWVSLLIVAVLTSCVGDVSQGLEEISALLDQRQFEQAKNKAESLASRHPANLEVQEAYAGTLLSFSALAGSSQCPNDEGLLGAFACLLDAKQSSETAFQTFARIAPPVERLSDLELSRDILLELVGQVTDPLKLQELYLKLYFARIFEIGGVVSRIGANSENLICNADPSNAKKDQLPDDYDANALTPAQEARFRDNLDQVNGDGRQAGIRDSIDLFSRFDDILNELGSDALPVFFDSQYNPPGENWDLCTEDK